MSTEELTAAWMQALAEAKAAQAMAMEKHRAADAAELAVLESKGEGHCLRAQWIRAWLGHQFAECDRLLQLRYPEQAVFPRPATPEEVEALRAEADLMERVGVSHAEF